MDTVQPESVGLNSAQLARIGEHLRTRYLSPGKILGGTPPILDHGFEVYSNPLPHVLILTAIVVGVATLALGLALVVRINEAYGTIEEDEIMDVVDREDQAE